MSLEFLTKYDVTSANEELAKRKQRINRSPGGYNDQIPGPRSKDAQARKELYNNKIQEHKDVINDFRQSYVKAQNAASLLRAKDIVVNNPDKSGKELLAELNQFPGIVEALNGSFGELSENNIEAIRTELSNEEYGKGFGIEVYENDNAKQEGNLLERAVAIDKKTKVAMEKFLKYLDSKDDDLNETNLDLWLTNRDLKKESFDVFSILELLTEGSAAKTDTLFSEVQTKAVDLLNKATDRNRTLNGSKAFDADERYIKESDPEMAYVEAFVHARSDAEALDNLTKLVEAKDRSSSRGGKTGFHIVSSKKFYADLVKAFGGNQLGEARALQFQEKLMKLTNNFIEGSKADKSDSNSSELNHKEKSLLKSGASGAYKKLIAAQVKQYKQYSENTTRLELETSLRNLNLSTTQQADVVTTFNSLLHIVSNDRDGLVAKHLEGSSSDTQTLVQNYLEEVKFYKAKIAALDPGTDEYKNMNEAYDMMEVALNDALSHEYGQLGDNLRNIIGTTIGKHIIKDPEHDSYNIADQTLDPIFREVINGEILKVANDRGITIGAVNRAKHERLEKFIDNLKARLSVETDPGRQVRMQNQLSKQNEIYAAQKTILDLQEAQGSKDYDALRKEHSTLFDKIKQSLSEILESVYSNTGFMFDGHTNQTQVFINKNNSDRLNKLRDGNNKTALDELVISAYEGINSNRSQIN